MDTALRTHETEGGFITPSSAFFSGPIYVDPKTTAGVANIYIRVRITCPLLFGPRHSRRRVRVGSPTSAESEAVRLNAARDLADRALGKAVERVNVAAATTVQRPW